MTDEVTVVDAKLDKLMTAYLENALTLQEYQNTKNKLVTEKHVLNDKLTSLARVSTSRFEPMIKFFNDCKQAEIMAKSDDRPNSVNFSKRSVRTHSSATAPSSLLPAHPSPSPLNSQKRQGKCGRRGRRGLGRNAVPSSTFCDTFAFFGRPCVFCDFAERKGFELLIPFRTYNLSRDAHSTAMGPLRGLHPSTLFS